MKKLRNLLKKAFTSVTIMVIPHDGLSALNLKFPMVGLLVIILLATIGGGCVLGLAINGLEYKAQHSAMDQKLKFYAGQFNQWDSTVNALKSAEGKFRQLFSLGSKEEVLEKVEASSVGSIEIPELIRELRKTALRVDAIKDYLAAQKDIYVATPRGYPATGEITSHYGKREDPFGNATEFHTGVDISCDASTPVRATADGVVSHSGWIGNSGNVVILEHGCGFSTVYAHNRSNSVKVGSRVKRGDIVGYVGTTGRSTGPHVHYEVWKDGKTVDAEKYLSGRS
ncbi:MAG TPA: M23 family metallopeptidase [Acidobacteriota bacterium]|nr:M23 family metallopeptidase [Acidobacteriota bacterium]